MRQPLHIHIDPSPGPLHPVVALSPDSTSPSLQSPASDTTRTTPSSGTSDQDDFYVLCIHDFHTLDPDQLSFRKGELLLIVKQEYSGWWAAMRKGGAVIGWIPKAFVRPLTDGMADRLANVREDLRVYEYDAELLYSAPAPPRIRYDHEPEPESQLLPRHHKTSRSPETIVQDQRQTYRRARPNPTFGTKYKHTPPSPTTVMPQPPIRVADVNKPTPPTPSGPSAPFMKSPTKNIYDTMTMNRSDSQNTISIISMVRKGKKPQHQERVLVLSPQQTLPAAQIHHPWYLQPRYEDQLELSDDNFVRFGSVPALVERLIRTHPDDKYFQNIFLMTFRTFMTAQELFREFVDYYHIQEPDNLRLNEQADWEEKGRVRIQKRILDLFNDWLENHHLLEEPDIARHLTEFLFTITTGLTGKTARQIQQRIQDLTFSIGSPINTISPSSSRKPRRKKPEKGDLLKIDPQEIAEQLTILQYTMYAKVLPSECLLYNKTSRGYENGQQNNLQEFCASHDKLVGWIKTSILTQDKIKERADTVDYWIKVAGKCKTLNNINSMSAIITALQSTVISRLPLTWAQVNKKSNLNVMARYHDPAGSFGTYRQLLNEVDSAGRTCVPLISMYLTDLAHIHDQYNEKESLICFYQRKRFYDAISIILRHQKHIYPFAMDEVGAFIRQHIQEVTSDTQWFWSKSQELQQLEFAHADIRKGLEQAGF